jgi:hypothetical protein
VSKLRPMKQPNPIAVRPRQGSKLEAVWNDNERSNKAMGEIIHSWASQFAEMAAASEQGENTND